MTNNFTYELDKSSKKHVCPQCGQRRFVRYVTVGTKQYVADISGRCDREDSCGYHLSPGQFFRQNNINTGSFPFPNIKEKETGNLLEIDYLPFDLFNLSVEQHRRCCLFPFLEKLLRSDIADFLCTNYFVGANRAGNTVFWQVDRGGNVRQAKVMVYNSSTGRRNRDTGAFFAGKKILNKPDANLQQCFFGEFLLTLPENIGKPVAVVESEKTCLIASVYYPNFIWLATGGKHGAKWTDKEICKVLRGKRVILFPDLGAYDQWNEKGKLLANVAGCTVVTSDVLEKNASEEERQGGLDIADYLLREQDTSGLALTDCGYPILWDYRVNRSSEISIPAETWRNAKNIENN